MVPEFTKNFVLYSVLQEITKDAIKRADDLKADHNNDPLIEVNPGKVTIIIGEIHTSGSFEFHYDSMNGEFKDAFVSHWSMDGDIITNPITEDWQP